MKYHSEVFLIEKEKQVNIDVEKGDLGLSLDDPLEDYKNKLMYGETDWEEMSKQINALVIFNKNDDSQQSRAWKKKAGKPR